MEEQLTIEQLQAELAELRAKQNEVPQNTGNKPARNANRKYKLLTATLATWGKVPQQQADLARILASNFAPEVEYTEAEVFAAIKENAGKFPSIANSVQDPTYLFRYYRNLKNDGKHGGFVARGFLQQVG